MCVCVYVCVCVACVPLRAAVCRCVTRLLSSEELAVLAGWWLQMCAHVPDMSVSE